MILRRIAALAVIFVLQGCPGVNPSKPEDTVVVGQKVEVGVREKCVVTLPDEPAWQVDLTPQPDPLERSKAILAELEQRRDWMNKAKAAVLKCR